MKFSLMINMDNEAFNDAPEAELRQAWEQAFAAALGQGPKQGRGTVHDSNGNRVGVWRIE